MKIIIFGSEGTLGQCVNRELYARGFDVLSLSHQDIDIADTDVLGYVIRDNRPDVVINCAGIIRGRNVPSSEYVSVNSLAPQYLAEVLDKVGGRLLQISTDCVFEGHIPIGNLWDETCTPMPTDIYAVTKLAGEVGRQPHLTVRTSFIGFGGRGLLAWLLQQRGQVNGYKHAYWNGFTAPILARKLVDLVQNWPDVSLLHLGTQCINKHDLLVRLVKKLNLKITVVDNGTPLEHCVNRCLGTVHEDIWKSLCITKLTLDEQLEELLK